MADMVSHPEDYFSRLVPKRDELLQSLEAHAFNQAMFSSSAWQSVQIFSYLPLHSGIYDGLCLAVRVHNQ
ncbi:MAG: hypothetical protein ACNA7H_00700 [Desulfotignum sp.]